MRASRTPTRAATKASSEPEEGPEAVDWLGAPISCDRCVLGRSALVRCELRRACVHDRYALRIDRFFRWNSRVADEFLVHPYFEVRAIAARYASVFRLLQLLDDTDETVRTMVAERIPRRLLMRLVHDPHREVRIRVAQRLEPSMLVVLSHDSDYGVRIWVARRAVPGLLAAMCNDPDPQVRIEVARRLKPSALHLLAADADPAVRRVVASRAGPGLLPVLAQDSCWEVRWEVAVRARRELAEKLLGDEEEEVSVAARSRLVALSTTPQGDPTE